MARANKLCLPCKWRGDGVNIASIKNSQVSGTSRLEVLLLSAQVTNRWDGNSKGSRSGRYLTTKNGGRCGRIPVFDSRHIHYFDYFFQNVNDATGTDDGFTDWEYDGFKGDDNTSLLTENDGISTYSNAFVSKCSSLHTSTVTLSNFLTWRTCLFESRKW